MEAQKQDLDNPHGTRSILFSKYKSILEGFNLNHAHPFDSVITQPISSEIKRSDCSATIQIAPLYPKINFMNPWKLPKYRFTLALGLIPDLIKGEKGYNPVNALMKFSPEQSSSDWMDPDQISPPLLLGIKLSNSTILDDSGTLVLSVGIEFQRALSGYMLRPPKPLGCAKLLALA